MHTGAGKLLLEIQVMPVRTTAKYIIASFKPQLATAGKPAVTEADSSSGYRSARITQMIQFKCPYTAVSSTASIHAITQGQTKHHRK